jgi:hypothetical protein
LRGSNREPARVADRGAPSQSRRTARQDPLTVPAVAPLALGLLFVAITIAAAAALRIQPDRTARP